MSTSSITSAVKKLSALLTRGEKKQCIGLVLFALCTSILEVITALCIVVFAQVLTQPQANQRYLMHLHKYGLLLNTSPSRFVFYVALSIGAIYLIKNSLMAFETFHQNFTIQEMGYHFNMGKKKVFFMDLAFGLKWCQWLTSDPNGGSTQFFYLTGPGSVIDANFHLGFQLGH